jgi:hypothetical protein
MPVHGALCERLGTLNIHGLRLRHVAAPILLAIALATMFGFAARPARADTPVTVGSGWIGTGGYLGEPTIDSPFTFTSAVPVTITVVDIACRGDEWTVSTGAGILGSTSEVPAYECSDPYPDATGPDEALLDPSYSSGSWTVPAGSHSVSMTLIAEAVTGWGASGAIRFDVAIQGPQWQVRAKVGGGNIYNQFLPDYEPDTWSTKNVTVYLFCVPGDAPIALLRADRAVQFKDGEHTYSTKPTDECIDEDGLAAQPIVEWGPIKVDTKAPTCKVTPSTIYVPRNTTQTVVWSVEFSDDGSGYLGIGASVINSGGASNVYIGGNDSPATTWSIEVTMGSSTAGKVTTYFAVYDRAFNVATCTAVAKAK